MDQQKIKDAAEQLDRLLKKYAPIDEAAASLQRALNGCINDALNRRITVPMEPRDVLGGRLFTETDLAKYDDLEKAYAHFKIQVTDSEKRSSYQYLQARIAEKRNLK